MKLPIVAILVLLWIVIFSIKKSKVERLENESSKKFWEKERSSNMVRKSDISQLPYIQIHLNQLPFQESDDTVLLQYQDTITSLSEKQILNLTGKTNTDLKLEYGPGNLEFLSACDQNFTLLARTLYNWGLYLYHQNQLEHAVTVLEFGIQCKTDVSGNYLILAELYNKLGKPEKISELLSVASSLNTLMKNSIINSLNNYQIK
ncbi:tetratricopeptide repeat protein [Anaeromicropila populeti]|uniref:Tetratricopeptide repeat-containing protein n=1 Tax=Anaeromicropila populeti TaxID=37658 RepID=A0A1I6IYP3_9FIRM|nr:hypothetical protein [Anaeromicropila populeti]SFR71813.1 hypothetical protein SAMN05661086_01259 [Anaeromicropila populeti]